MITSFYQEDDWGSFKFIYGSLNINQPSLWCLVLMVAYVFNNEVVYLNLKLILNIIKCLSLLISR